MVASHVTSARIDWRRIFVEVLVIVSSILLALAAESWWQERGDRAEEQVILAALHAEFAGNVASLQAQADSLASARSQVRSIVEMGEAAFRALRESDRRELVAAIRRPRTIELRVGALEGTLGTERAGLLESAQLRSALAEYESVRTELAEIGSLVRALSLEASIVFAGWPRGYQELAALLSAKEGYWEAYSRFVERLIDETRVVIGLLQEELE